MLYAPWNAFMDPDKLSFGDFGRYAHKQIAIDIIRSDIWIAIFGCGFRASGNLIGPALADFYSAHGMGRFSARVADYGSSLGYTTLLVETGMVGILLYISNFLCVFLGILRAERSPFRYTLLLALTLSAMWFLVTNPYDILLGHLLIMPSGLFLMLCSPHKSPDKCLT